VAGQEEEDLDRLGLASTSIGGCAVAFFVLALFLIVALIYLVLGLGFWVS